MYKSGYEWLKQIKLSFSYFFRHSVLKQVPVKFAIISKTFKHVVKLNQFFQINKSFKRLNTNKKKPYINGDTIHAQTLLISRTDLSLIHITHSLTLVRDVCKDGVKVLRSFDYDKSLQLAQSVRLLSHQNIYSLAEAASTFLLWVSTQLRKKI